METPLKKHLDAKRISDADFAKLIGRDRSTVNRLKSGKVRPTLDVAILIERVTKGKVPVRAWEKKGDAK